MPPAANHLLHGFGSTRPGCHPPGGDREAFAQIYRRYQHVVFRFGRAMTGSDSAAEDLTQETFVALFTNLARYEPDRASFSTYLYGVVRNLSRERLRREDRFLSLETLGVATATRYEADPAIALDDAELAAQVRRVLRRLPSRYRELIVLCDLHGLSYADAADVAGVSVPAVRSRLHRGRQLLRRRLAPLARVIQRNPITIAGCAI